jgi:hypothetical protein
MVSIQIGHIQNEYILHVTNAAISFDLPTTITAIKDGEFRYVFLLDEDMAEQLKLYPQDCSTVVHVNTHILKYACEKLFKKLLKGIESL